MEVGHKPHAGEQNHGKGKSAGVRDGVNGTALIPARGWNSGCTSHLCQLEIVLVLF